MSESDAIKFLKKYFKGRHGVEKTSPKKYNKPEEYTAWITTEIPRGGNTYFKSSLDNQVILLFRMDKDLSYNQFKTALTLFDII